jgi:hypothetical protein
MLSASALLDHRVSHKPFIFLRPSIASKDVSYAFHYSSKRTGRFKTMLQQADDEQLDAIDGRRKIKGLCETRWSSRADALLLFGKFCYVLVQLLPDIVILSNFSKA